MKRYLFLLVGYETPTTEVLNEWEGWLDKHIDRIEGVGGQLSKGVYLTKDSVEQLDWDDESLSLVSIYKAADFEEAQAIAQDAPITQAVQLYEIYSYR